ncbi:MAG TPA: hypothetical protein ENJ77_01520 [Candidatus Moranbacteria bacterium]|nr:hypothetical protein [Candidatus Moranbacteria bacterium]
MFLNRDTQTVPGTVGNWLDDYRFSVGAGKHSAIERGDYLFHNRNTKLLSAEDRQKVAVILKSADEDIPLTIDPENEKVIFPREMLKERTKKEALAETAKGEVLREKFARRVSSVSDISSPSASANTASRADKKPIGFIRFSSGQKMPAEEKSDSAIKKGKTEESGTSSV